jgi:hypothetical protein
VTIWLRFSTGKAHAFRADRATRSACGIVTVNRPAGEYSADAEQGPVRVAKPNSPCGHCMDAVWPRKNASAGGRSGR